MRLRNMLVGLGCAMALAGATPVACGQTTNGVGEDGGSRARTPPPGAGGRALDGARPILNVLTPEQRGSFGQAMQAQRDRVRALELKISEARRELLATAVAGEFDKDAVRKRAQAVAELEAEIAVLRMEALSKVQPPLSPEQIRRITNSVPDRPEPVVRPPIPPGRRRILSSPDRDENDLPAKGR